MNQDFTFNEDVAGFFGNYIICYLIIVFTLGIGTPWAICRMEGWKANNTTIDGRKVKFVGEGSHLLGKFIVWYLLTIITVGIYGFWAAVKMQKWKTEHVVFVN